MSYYTANVKLYENSSGAIGTTGNVLAFNPNDVVPDATVTANSLLTGGLVTLQTGGGAPVPTFPVTVVGTPANGQVPVWNNTNHDWEPGAGSGTYVPLPPQIAASSGLTTRRATLHMCGDGGNGLQSSLVDIAQRLAVMLPVTTTRWRLRFHNWDAFPGTANAGALAYTGVWLGTPLYDATGKWNNGTLTGAPTQVFTSFSTPSDGSEYVSAWVTDPTMQFTAQKASALCFGFTTGGASLIKSGDSGWIAYGTSGTTASASAGSASLVAGTGGAVASNALFVDTQIEYEYVGVDEIGLFIGDSITVGYIGSGVAATTGPCASWPSAAALRQQFVAVNAGRGGLQSQDFAKPAAFPRLTTGRFDLTTTVPDFAVIALGSNDAASSISLASFQANMAAIVTSIRALGINRIYAATVIPRNFTGASAQETARLSYNAWLRTLPLGLNGVIDVGGAMEVPGAVNTMSAYYVTSYPHPDAAGYQRMADLIPPLGRRAG